jgi:thioredoxin-like negative regulator of GroEL
MDEIRQDADLETVLETFWGKASEARAQGNDEEARGWLEAIVELDQHDADAWLALAKLVPDARERMLCYSQVLQLSPGNSEAKDGLRQARREL